MPVEPRRPRAHRPAAERREQLLDAAVEVMRVGGIGAATTRAVAERAGLPQGAFHYCFRSKDELFVALLDRELDASLGSAWDAVADTDDLGTGIAAALWAILNRVRSDPEYHLLTAELVDVAARTPGLEHVARREQLAYVEQADRLLRRWQESGRGPLTIGSRTLAEALVAASTGITSSWLSARDDEAAHASVALFASALARAAV
ncbi:MULTISPECIES: TetR/AcrR family transcriptional regulator [Pseudonocardia]|uniref:HTH-type transcriptional regulator SrpR n=2 Tax=Pseudonocardia TaxID=1847 RepID=A0A1Y2MR56_PSEAH|nr:MULTISPECIES: TetR/AcrR family transcriptional regulator [Pseudonocardia]OSY37197.1 HTH-type transcriptional regulator SrpR [Pseudonocardia autotrophica]TDN74818.1 TetR family transcriptional regulator [Pseudonocardia autotrophica]BBG05593.1 TetR family transcriptional regulator [Pseudonocardia autotrophica]GEC25844.1 TetR family transcriptional regulator [Pseudonocardia saturnea]